MGLIGLEGSVDGTSLSKTSAVVLPRRHDSVSTLDRRYSGIDSRPLGVAWDRVLIYATGGVAFGGIQHYCVDFESRICGFFGSGNVSNTRVGWTVGGGIEYAVTNNWSILAEYRYTNFGSIRQNDFGVLPAGVFFNGSHQINQNQVQVGFDYKFDFYAPPPVVAKY